MVYTHKPEDVVQENETHKILLDFEIQTDRNTLGQALYWLIRKKLSSGRFFSSSGPQRTEKAVDSDGDTYAKAWKEDRTNWRKDWRNWKGDWRNLRKHQNHTVLLSSTKIFRRTHCHIDSSERPLVKVGVKNSQGVK